MQTIEIEPREVENATQIFPDKGEEVTIRADESIQRKLYALLRKYKEKYDATEYLDEYMSALYTRVTSYCMGLWDSKVLKDKDYLNIQRFLWYGGKVHRGYFNERGSFQEDIDLEDGV